MKKIFNNLLMMAMMATAAVSFTSCDDEEIAYTLEGTWKGNMYISSYYDGRTYNSTYTEITFLKDPTTYSSGTGYWVDYYDSDSPWGGYVANHIEWTVDWGDIKIYFVEEGTSMLISDYHLDDSRFWGTINDGGQRVDFELYHTSSPNYNNYRWGYDSYYYRTRGDGTTPEKPIRFVRPKE
jgi:hypothetical protein